ncbi:MAG TPA: hypothetical protein DDW90_00710 [Cyanobacteria bacterium UBA9971]|nr:hypothetical protein [Cyanobacteria bacterium UBA9971]
MNKVCEAGERTPLFLTKCQEKKDEAQNRCEENEVQGCNAFKVLHENKALHVNVKSFNLLRAITDMNFFSKVDLSPTARLVMFSLANMYNPKKGFVYPKNNKLMKCTGSGERAISQAISELKKEGIIVIVFEENFRKIYFTQKTYALLGVINEEILNPVFEKEIDFKATEILLKERKFKDNGFAVKEEKNTEGVAKNTEGVAKNEDTCHEQKKEQIKKQFVENNLFFLKERNEIKEAFKNGGYLTNKLQSEIILNGFHQHNVRKDDDFKIILRIKNVWNFKTEKFNILRFIEEKRKNDRTFSQKIEKIENDVEFSLIGLEKEIEELRVCWSPYKNRQ